MKTIIASLLILVLLSTILLTIGAEHAMADTRRVFLPSGRIYDVQHSTNVTQEWHAASAVIWLHAHTGTSGDMAMAIGDFGPDVIMVYGQADRHADGTIQWYDGRWPQVTSDVAYLRELIADLAARYQNINPYRVAIAGYSNGAMMAARLFCEHHPLAIPIASFVLIAASIPVAQPCIAPNWYARLLIIHGTDDAVVPYDGGPLTHPGEVGEVYGVEQSLDLATAGRCPPEWHTLDAIIDGVDATWRWHIACGPSRVSLTLHGSGHEWPTLAPAIVRQSLDHH